MNAVTQTAQARPLIEAPIKFRLRPGGASSGSGCFLKCARCDAPAWIRRSARISEQVTQMICHCTDSACGHTFRADIVFVHSLCPGNFDRPDLELPVCPPEKVPHVRPPSTAGPDDEPSFFSGDVAAG